MAALPTGNVTFLFTDIEGSTSLIDRHGEAMRPALARHHALVRDAVEAHAGHVFNVVGDGLCCAFSEAAPAVSAALAAQRALHREPWGAIGRVRSRMGLHTGSAEAAGDGYVSSLSLVRVQRVMASGHGGQTLVSAATAEAARARLPAGTTLRDLGAYKLRGLAAPEAICELVAPDLPSQFPPLRAEVAGASAGSLGELVRGRLVGRGGELEQLRQHWAEAQQARGHLVLLSGEPGIGKTRLAQELLTHAQRHGATLLRGGCYEYEATTPYLPFAEAIREWVRSASDADVHAALGATAAEIARFAPEIEARLGPLAHGPALAPAEERLRLFDGVARFLRSLAPAHGLLVFLDDLHWADQGTLALLQYLLRHLRRERVLILGAYREAELDRAHPLARALVDWNREHLAVRLSLARLSYDDTAAMLAVLFGQQSVAPEFAAALHRETEGNPFFVEEVVKALIEQGDIYRENDEWNRREAHELTIPQSVKEAIGRRLDRLSSAATDALRIAAALGKDFSFRDVKAVSSVTEDELLDALDEAHAAQLIRVADRNSRAGAPGDGFVFTHDKIREVLYEELIPVRRQRLHQRIGTALERLHGGPVAEGATPPPNLPAPDLAYHFAQAGDLARSLFYARLAAAAAERVFAHDEALAFLDQAREAALALDRPDEVAALDERIGDIHVARGTIRPAVEHYERALLATQSQAARAALKVKVGNACTPVGDPHGLARLEEALAELDPATQASALALATALVGRYHHYQTRHRKALEFLERARELAEPLNDPGTLGNIYCYLAGAHQHLLEYGRSDTWARACVALGERHERPLTIAQGSEFLAENAAGRGHWEEALRHGARDEAYGKKSGSIARVAWAGFPRATALWGMGRLEAARDAALEAVALCEQIGEDRLAAWLESSTAVTLAELGDLAPAAAHAQRGWEHACSLDQLILSAWALNGLGYVALARDDVEGALAWYEQYLVLIRETENNMARNQVLARAAEAFLRAGALDRASDLVGQAIAVATEGKSPHYLALARRVQGQVYAARRRHDDARRAYDEALETFAAIGSRLERARALHHRARLAFELGEAPSARHDAEHALAEFTAMHAERDRQLVARLLQ